MNFKTKILIALIKVVGGTFIFGIVATVGFAVIDLVSLLFGIEIAHPLPEKWRYLIYPLIPIVTGFYLYAKYKMKKHAFLQ